MKNTNGKTVARRDEQPAMVLFQNLPKWQERDPLISSLQGLESCLMLIALQRYPHALVTLVSALESGLKAGLGLNERDRKGLVALFDMARTDKQAFHDYSRSHLFEMLNHRNAIVHHGFSPRDDNGSAALLVRIGFPLLCDCHSTFFGFDVFKGLGPFGYFLRTAIAAGKQVPGPACIQHVHALIGVAHSVFWSIHQGMLPYWQGEALGLMDEMGEDPRPALRDQLDARIEREGGFPVSIQCPVCGEPDMLVCDLHADKGEVEKGLLSVEWGRCVNCRLLFPKGATVIADLLCADGLTEQKPKLMRALGIA